MSDNKELDLSTITDVANDSMEDKIKEALDTALDIEGSSDTSNDAFVEKSAEDSNTDKKDTASDSSENDKNDEKTDKAVEEKKKTKLFGKKDKKSKDKKETDADKSEVKEAEVEESIEDYKVDEDGNFVKKKKRKRRLKRSSRRPEDINIVKELLSLIIYFAIVILAVYFILTFVGCKSLVSGPSMNPTLHDMDQVWVDKLTYRFSDPKRFDVIIFNYDENTTYVKRIIGLPGETVKIDTNGNIYINDKLMNESYGLERIAANKIGRASEPILLGKDEYFVLGDNRNNSSDSRFADVGNVQKEDIVGKVLVRISPFKDFGIIK